MMNTVKKFLPLLLIGIFSSGITLLGVNYLNSSNSFSNANERTDANSHFTNSKFVGITSANNTDFTTAAEKTTNSVVSIKNFSSNTRGSMNDFEFFFGFGGQQQNKNQPSGLGSGVIISKDGYIITNNHVIKDADKLEVTLNNQQTYTAQLIGTDPNTDIALIKIEEDNLPFLNFYDSDQVQVGEWVLAVGNPFGLTSTVTAGIISAKGRSINILSSADNPIESFIQTDAAVNPGNSGGALVNTNGDLVGINTAISSRTGSYEGYAFAVPSNLAKKIVEDLKGYGRVQRGYIGIVPLDLTDEQQLNVYNSQYNKDIKTQEGVMVLSLSADGAAYEAGIEEGDIITSIDGNNIKNFASLSSAIGSKRPGEKVSITLKRGNSTKSYTLKLKDQNGSTSLRGIDDLSVKEKLDADFQPLTEKQKINYGLKSGVWVTRISQSSMLVKAGINKDYIILEVNGKEVDSEKDIDKILNKYKGNVSVKFIDRYGRVYNRGFQFN